MLLSLKQTCSVPKCKKIPRHRAWKQIFHTWTYYPYEGTEYTIKESTDTENKCMYIDQLLKCKFITFYKPGKRMTFESISL